MTKEFWIDAGIRAVRTIAQTAVASLSTAAALSDVDWRMVASSAALAGLLSVLMSLNTLGTPGTAQTRSDGKE